jgi:sulfide:quinone oxidoreductase
MARTAQPHVVVLGGGFGGLEAAFALRHTLPAEATITLVSDRDYFLFKPNTVYVPFGLDPDKLKINLGRATRRAGIPFVQARVSEIDPEGQRLHLDGQRMRYDYLVVATGAGMRPEEVPGLAEFAETIWAPADMLRLQLAFYQLAEVARQGHHREVLFLVPPNNKCSGPLYEMVLMLDTWLRRKRARSNVTLRWSTYEDGYIQAFGPRLDTTVSEEFARRNIIGYKRYSVTQVERAAVHYANGQTLPYDLLVSFPPYVAALPLPGLPSDERGFLTTELESRRVVGHPTIFAVGDAGNFPVKQAFLAFLQADAAASAINAAIRGTAPDVVFDPISMCVMEEFDRATFAQVPLRLTGRPDQPIEVRPDAPELYRVGTSPAWRLGKSLLGLYLPWRFGAGNAFHMGLPWKGMEVGLKVMSRVLAS